MGVFVARCQWRVWPQERSSDERRPYTADTHLRGERGGREREGRKRQEVMFSSNCQTRFTQTFEMSSSGKLCQINRPLEYKNSHHDKKKGVLQNL